MQLYECKNAIFEKGFNPLCRLHKIDTCHKGMPFSWYIIACTYFINELSNIAICTVNCFLFVRGNFKVRQVWVA